MCIYLFIYLFGCLRHPTVPPSLPDFLSAIPVSSKAIKLSWKPGFDGHSAIISYSVSMKRETGAYSQVAHQITTTTFIVDALDPYVTYTFKVSAWNAIGQGESANVTNQTLEDGK